MAEEHILPTNELTSEDKTSRLRLIGELVKGPYPTLISRLVLGGVFLVAGVTKIMAPDDFAANIAAYKMAPPAIIQPMALGLPWVEVLVAVYLLVGLFLRWTAAVTGFLLVIFLIAMSYAMYQGTALDCGCFGNVSGTHQLQEQVGFDSLVRDGIWLAMAAHLIFIPSIFSVDQLIKRRRDESAESAESEEEI